MEPGIYHIALRKGITYGPVLVQCQATEETPYDLTGCTAHAQARRNVNGSVAVDLAPVITDAAAGEVTLHLTDEETLLLPAGDYRWDLVIEKPDGSRIGPILAGRCTVEAINTQP